MISFILIIAIAGIMIFNFIDFSDYSLQLGAFTPLATFVLLALAHHNIKKDDKLVKSMDRLR